MSARRPFIFFALSIAIAFAGHAQGAKADSITSDRLLVTNLATGAVLFDSTIPEPAPGESEGGLEFDAEFTGYGGGSVINAVILTEPAGEPPGESAILVPGTDLIASDLLVMNIFAVNFPTLWTFQLLVFSDGHPQFEGFVSSYGRFAPLLEETGSLQDLTYLLHSDVAGFRVQFQSDVIPEPGTGLLVMTGLLGLAYRQRR